MLPKKTKEIIVHLAEEVLGIQSDFSDLSLNLHFSEKDGNLEMVCESAGAPVNPLEEGVLEDEIGLRLIRARSETVHYTYENGKNILTLRIK